MSYPDDALAAFLAHVIACHPSEGCGLVLRDPAGGLRFRAMANVADRYHAADPVAFPRSSREAYLFDPREQLEVFAGPDEVVAIAHSHCDVGAYFSAKDREDALGGTAEPLFPGVEYLVASVRSAPGGPIADELRAYRFEGGQFKERVLALPLPREGAKTPAGS